MGVGAGGVADGREQMLLAGEAAVDCSDADARPPRHCLDRHIDALLGKELMCRLGHTLKIASRFLALAPLLADRLALHDPLHLTRTHRSHGSKSTIPRV